MDESPGQVEQGWMIYPGRGWRWLAFRLPLWLWRMGLGPVMHRRFCVLTTWGRKSREPRPTLVEWVEDRGRVCVAAGWGPRSHWVRNILADPNVTVQSGLGTTRGRAERVTDGDVLRRLYPEMRKSPVWDDYCRSWGVDGSDPEDVARNAERMWTFVVEPAAVDAPPPMKSDLVWIPIAVGLIVLGAVLL